MPVDRLELILQFASTFAGTKKQNPIGLQSEMKQRQRFLLCAGLQINQQVTTGDQFHPGERSILDDIVRGKHNHLPDSLIDRETPFVLREIGDQPIGRNIADTLLAVDSVPRLIQRDTMHIGGKNASGNVFAAGENSFVKQNGDRIRFLARRTSRDPSSKFCI